MTHDLNRRSFVAGLGAATAVAAPAAPADTTAGEAAAAPDYRTAVGIQEGCTASTAPYHCAGGS
jgi:hypothetical protein